MYGHVRGTRPPASGSPRASTTVYEYFNWERVIDHVDAVVLVVLVRLVRANTYQFETEHVAI
jgi:hypothetical protein